MSAEQGIHLSREQLKRVLAAFDTALGCLMLVEQDRKPIDLDECMKEIGGTYDDLCALAGEFVVGA